jgi:hypothetical protein
MQRRYGALAVFGGWLCIPLSVVSGLIATQVLGFAHTLGPPPPTGVYGTDAIIVFWVIVSVAILTLAPVVASVSAPAPGRREYAAAAAMAIAGIVLLPDDLGRAISLALLPGAGLFAVGGWWLEQAGHIEAQLEAAPAATPAATRDATRAATRDAEVAPLSGPTADAEVLGSGAATAERATPETASATGRSGRPRKSGRAAAGPGSFCPWCSAPIRRGADRCPGCGAALIFARKTENDPIPGLTSVDPRLQAYAEKAAARKKRSGLLSMIRADDEDRLAGTGPEELDPAVLGPPSAEVRAEMARIDREIAARTGSGDTSAHLPPETDAPSDGHTPSNADP